MYQQRNLKKRGNFTRQNYQHEKFMDTRGEGNASVDSQDGHDFLGQVFYTALNNLDCQCVVCFYPILKDDFK